MSASRQTRSELIIGSGGGAQLANGAQGGFLWLPVVDGHPATPTDTRTDAAPVCIDGTNRELIWFDKEFGTAGAWRTLIQTGFRLRVRPSRLDFAPTLDAGTGLYWKTDLDLGGDYNVVRVHSTATDNGVPVPDWYLSSIKPPDPSDGACLFLINDDAGQDVGMHIVCEGSATIGSHGGTAAYRIFDPQLANENSRHRNHFSQFVYANDGTKPRWYRIAYTI